jgi:hypothetical protein
MSRWIGVMALVALGCAACGGEAPQVPAGPSGAGTAAPGATSMTPGAKIMGNVTAGEPLAALAAQVVGTPLSAPVGTGGGFSLEGVPEGGVQLRFVGSGVDASVSLSPVKPGDLVSLLVGVSGATATVQSESRNAGGKVELEGRIESLPPTQPDNTLVVGGRTVTTAPGATVFRDGNDAARSFADLAVGQRVHVKGTLAVDKIMADSITIQNTHSAIPANLNGIVERLTGAASAFSFFIGSREIKGDATTGFFGDMDAPRTFSALANGARVEVKGEQRDAYVFAVRIHINGPAMPEPRQDDSASVEGRLEKITGTKPALTLEIKSSGVTTIVTTTSSTEVRRRGDVQTLDALAVGQTVHAVGTRMADKSIVARMLQIKDDEPEGAFVIAGSLGGLKGSCPVISFGVNGYAVKTSAATKYYPETPPPAAKCEDLKSGTKIEVEGKRQADGSVLAEKITKK